MNVYEKLRKARVVGCPLVSFSTGDPGAAAMQILKTIVTKEQAAKMESAQEKVPVVQWDCSRGVTPVRTSAIVGWFPGEAESVAESLNGGDDEGDQDLHDVLVRAARLPRKFVLIIHNAHKFLRGDHATQYVQAIWNARDSFKSKPSKVLILMGPTVPIPPELRHDVVELDEPLPTDEELRDVISSTAKSAKLKLTDKVLGDACRASTGLTAFGAEQLSALNMSKDGLSVSGIWSDKCQKINETPGLKVVSDGTFDDLAGYDSVKEFLSRILSGPKKPSGVVYIDEIEKSMGGVSGDMSGTSQDQLSILLQYMQDRRAAGCIFAGPPGSGKSKMAKCAGSEGDVLTIQLDLGAMKDQYVGSSEQRIREALKVLDAVTGGNTLWLATANSIDRVPPELKRRFKYGTWYFDLPGEDERKAIWDLYCKRYDVRADWAEDLVGNEWTGAEIESCCEIADRTGLTVTQAAQYIVPVAKTAKAQIEALRQAAEGRWLSANHPGPYRRLEIDQDAGVRSFGE